MQYYSRLSGGGDGVCYMLNFKRAFLIGSCELLLTHRVLSIPVERFPGTYEGVLGAGPGGRGVCPQRRGRTCAAQRPASPRGGGLLALVHTQGFATGRILLKTHPSW